MTHLQNNENWWICYYRVSQIVWDKRRNICERREVQLHKNVFRSKIVGDTLYTLCQNIYFCQKRTRLAKNRNSINVKNSGNLCDDHALIFARKIMNLQHTVYRVSQHMDRSFVCQNICQIKRRSIMHSWARMFKICNNLPKTCWDTLYIFFSDFHCDHVHKIT